MLRMGLLQLLCVHLNPLHLSHLSVVVDVAGGRAGALPPHLDSVLMCLTLLKKFDQLELAPHERLSDELESDLLPLQFPLLFALLFDDLAFDLALGHLLRGCDGAVEIEPDVLRVVRY